jgi:hypothetical protein
MSYRREHIGGPSYSARAALAALDPIARHFDLPLSAQSVGWLPTACTSIDRPCAAQQSAAAGTAGRHPDEQRKLIQFILDPLQKVLSEGVRVR